MSLINDALKRAKQAQQQTPPPSEPPPHAPPIEPAQHVRHNLGLLLPAMFAIIAMLMLFVLWQAAQKNRPAQANQTTKGQTEVAASTRTAPSPASPPTPTFTKIDKPSPPSEAANAANMVAAPSALATTNSAVPGNETGAVTNTSPTNALTEPPAPKPAPLRLQAIIFNPKRPSVMIGGKTLFIGDKLGELRIVAIDRGSAILAGAGQTNVLTLPDQ